MTRIFSNVDLRNKTVRFRNFISLKLILIISGRNKLDWPERLSVFSGRIDNHIFKIQKKTSHSKTLLKGQKKWPKKGQISSVIFWKVRSRCLERFKQKRRQNAIIDVMLASLQRTKSIETSQAILFHCYFFYPSMGAQITHTYCRAANKLNVKHGS